MTIRTSFFDDIIQHTNMDFVNEKAALLADGVYGVGIGDFLVAQHSPANLSVDVAAGNAIKNGYYVKSDSVTNPTITANVSGFNRIDIIVLNVDTTGKVTTIIVVAGTPNSSPTAPIPTASQLKIAEVFVGNNVSVINTANITDKRINVELAYTNPACRVYRTTIQSIATGTLVTQTYDTERYDTDNIYDPVANNTRLTCKTAGKYLIMATSEFQGTATATLRAMRIQKNGDAAKILSYDSRLSLITESTILHCAAVNDMIIGDYVEVIYYHNAGSAINSATRNVSCPDFMIVKVG